jgi:hypothetical protein
LSVSVTVLRLSSNMETVSLPLLSATFLGNFDKSSETEVVWRACPSSGFGPMPGLSDLKSSLATPKEAQVLHWLPVKAPSALQHGSWPIPAGEHLLPSLLKTL